MKKNILVLLITAGVTTGLLLSGCSKDDTAAPNISLNGSSSEEVSLQSTWTDPGATANDEEDGTVSVTSDASSTNPNTNMVGTYTITYTATDAAGNQSTSVRSVRVKNDAEWMADTYAVSDVVATTVFSYNQTITVDLTENNKVHFDRFGDYAGNDQIYGIVNSTDSSLSIPDQNSNKDIGMGVGPCDVQRHNFRSTAFLELSNGFKINYVDSLTTGATCAGTVTTGEATFVR